MRVLKRMYVIHVKGLIHYSKYTNVTQIIHSSTSNHRTDTFNRHIQANNKNLPSKIYFITPVHAIDCLPVDVIYKFS